MLLQINVKIMYIENTSYAISVLNSIPDTTFSINLVKKKVNVASLVRILFVALLKEIHKLKVIFLLLIHPFHLLL